jgi:hypothetical protein
VSIQDVANAIVAAVSDSSSEAVRTGAVKFYARRNYAAGSGDPPPPEYGRTHVIEIDLEVEDEVNVGIAHPDFRLPSNGDPGNREYVKQFIIWATVHVGPGDFEVKPVPPGDVVRAIDAGQRSTPEKTVPPGERQKYGPEKGGRVQVRDKPYADGRHCQKWECSMSMPGTMPPSEPDGEPLTGGNAGSLAGGDLSPREPSSGSVCRDSRPEMRWEPVCAGQIVSVGGIGEVRGRCEEEVCEELASQQVLAVDPPEPVSEEEKEMVVGEVAVVTDDVTGMRGPVETSAAAPVATDGTGAEEVQE